MTRERATELMMESVMGSLSVQERDELDSYLADDEMRRELLLLESLWHRLGQLDLPAPDPSSSARFVAALEEETGRRDPPTASLRSHPIWWTRVAAVVTLLGATLGGAIVGRVTRPAALEAPDSGSRFLLLVLGGEPPAGVPEEELVDEFRTWASDLAADGRLQSAEKLRDDVGARVGASPRGDPDLPVGGFFVVRASDLAEARAIAATSPHLRFGGAVEVRPIEETGAS